ncbi:Amino acid transporter AVT6A [Vitis vinifera]|uniref:Amino acid transporter AVT6A n=1 Tax=Vitis vinifera TaxID=29760 RepID=A0A438F8K6_VITVI|nr:Amino acid transporter AVT6A [Vitis vinifera]
MVGKGFGRLKATKLLGGKFPKTWEGLSRSTAFIIYQIQSRLRPVHPTATDFSGRNDRNRSHHHRIPNRLTLIYSQRPNLSQNDDFGLCRPEVPPEPQSTLLPQKYDDADSFEVGFSGASFSGAVFNLSTTVVGAGIMALPATIKQLGMIPGLIMILLGALLTESSIEMILRFSRASKSSSYSGVVGDAFGGVGRTVLQICVVVNNMGMLIVYMIIIGDVLSGTWLDKVHHLGVVEEWFGQHWWSTRSFLLLLTTLLVLTPLISFKRVDSLRYTSALSVALAVVFVAITAGVAIVKLVEGSIGMPRLLPEIVDQASFWKLFTTVPVLVTAYICHHNIHPIEKELHDQTQMKPIVRTSLMLCTSVYIATSFFGFLLFGDRTLDDVLANFDGDLGIPYSSLLNDVHLDAFQFTGATAVAVGFIFPAAIALRDTHGIATKNDRLVSCVMILLAVSASTVAISSDIYSIFNR